jgi:hypothetical protein
MVSLPAFTRWGGVAINDLLALLGTLAAFVAVGSLIRGAPSWVVALPPIVCTAVLATRAQGIVTVAVCAAALAIVGCLGARRALMFGGAAATLALPIVVTAPFWIRNVETTGSVIGYRPDFYADLARIHRPAGEAGARGLW